MERDECGDEVRSETSFSLCLKDGGPGFAELKDVYLDVKDRIKENNYRRYLLYTSIVYLIILLIELSKSHVHLVSSFLNS